MMGLDNGNGNGHQVPLSRLEWEEHRDLMVDAAKKIDEMHQKIPVFLEHTSHLKKLDYLKDIKDSLLSAAIGSDRVPLRIFSKVVGILGIVSIALVFVLVFMLTGEAAGWLPQLNH